MSEYDWTLCKRETLEKLAAAVSRMNLNLTEYWEDEAKDLVDAHRVALDAARAEAAPKLRTRAEVDAEIAREVRLSVARGCDEDFFYAQCRQEEQRVSRVRQLCAEPLAPEPDPNHTDVVQPDDAPEPERCSCEEALTLREKLKAVREILRELAAPGITLEMRKSHALGATMRIWAVIGQPP